ncbi:hypothetical protein D922_04030 [Enterococcus faecalis 06-MB-DW-09]|nr:hypothetical protein D922_04030 [Enterococcus faecalis 06-MB-DW-09]
MARQRDPKRDQAFELFKKSDGTITNREIAKQLDVHEKTISAWKSRDKWNAVLQNGKCSTAKDDSSTTNIGGAPPNNKNAVGNKGNKNASPPKRNNNALKHGLYAKYLPGETYELAEAFDTEDPADLLWGQITTTHALILQTHKIMHVTDNEDHSKEVSGWSSGEGGSSETYALQYAWDKHANYINTITRATNSLSNLIKQFVSLADEQDERRKKLELMDAQIAKLEASMPAGGEDDGEPIIIEDPWRKQS